MFRKCVPSNRVSSFRPTLEVLEDRTMPSSFGDFLAGFGGGSITSIKSAESLTKSVNAAVVAFNQSPNDANFISLLNQTFQFEAAFIQAEQAVTVFSTLVNATATLGLGGVSNAEMFFLQTDAIEDNERLAALSSKLTVAIGDVLNGLSIVVAQGTSANLASLNPPTISDISVSTSVPGGSAVTAFVTITDGDGEPVTLSYAANEGSGGGSNSITEPVTGDGQVSLSAPGLPSGHFYTWTAIMGNATESTVTNFV